MGEGLEMWLVHMVMSSLVPRPSNRGGKAWYTLFAHAFNLRLRVPFDRK